VTAQSGRDLAQEISVLLDDFAVVIQDADKAFDKAESVCLVVSGCTHVCQNLPCMEIISRTWGTAGAAMLLILSLGCAAESSITAG
jgi:hypothetical protein